jgi:uncharacterized membrane protein YagU involved in acid resistance
MSSGLPAPFGYLIVWGFIATVAMTSILEGSRGLGFSRMSLPFLVGTFFSGSRRWALILGFIVYIIGGSLFAFLYYFVFASVGIYTWWFGTLVGFLHGLVLLVIALPLLPFVHPRMASEYHGVSARRQLEPPGFLAMNYGNGTPVSTVVGQIIFGLTLGGFLQLERVMSG